MDNSFLIRLGVDTQQLIAGVNKSNQILNGFQNQVASFGKQMVAGLGFYSLSQSIVQAVERMAQFDHAMSGVKAITNATSLEFQALRNNALNLAGAFSALDIAKLETEFGRLGFSTKEIMDSTKTAIQLASASGEDLAKSAQIAGSVIRAFDLNTSDMGRVGDVMAAGFNKSALSLSDFGEAMKYVAPVAHAAGLSLEQVTAALGVLADANIKGSMAGTSFRKIITDLGQGSADKFSEKLSEMAAKGIDASTALDEVGRTAYASLLVLGNHTDKLDAATKAYSNSSGELQKMAAIMENDLVGDWHKLNAEWDRTIQTQNNVSGNMRALTNSATEMLKVLNGTGSKAFSLQNPFGGLFDESKEEIEFKKSMDKIKQDFISTLNAMNKDAVELNPFDALLLKQTTKGPMTPNEMRIEGLNQNKGGGKKDAPFDALGMQQTTQILGTGWANQLAEDAVKAAESLGFVKQALGETKNEFSDMWEAQRQSDDEFENFHEAIEPSVTSAVDKIIAAHNKLKSNTIQTAVSLQQLGRQLKNVFVTIATDIGQALGQAISGDGGVEKILLGSLGGVLIQMGRMAIEIGIGLDAIKIAFESLNPAVAIAAGIGLVALGTYFSNKSASIGNSIGGSGGGGSQPVPIRAADQTSQYTFRIDGRDLVTTYDKNKIYDGYQKG